MKRKNLFPFLVSGINQIQDEINGQRIDVSLDKSTYVMTISLIDKNGNTLNEKTVDFPMETAFVNASYDKTTKTMVFTLESGVTVDVPLGDLVEGLVSQTDFDVLSGEVQTLKTEVNNNTNAISDINDNLDNLKHSDVAGGKNLAYSVTYGSECSEDSLQYNVHDIWGTNALNINCNLKANVRYIMSLEAKVSTNDNIYIIYNYEDGTKSQPRTLRQIGTSFESFIIDIFPDKNTNSISIGCNHSDYTFSIKKTVQVEEGTVATDYEPYIPSVKMIADDLSNINSNMSDYGLNNVFDGEFIKGRYNTTTNIVEYNANFLCCKNKISCNSGDKITLKTTKLFNRFFVHFFNSGTYVSTYDGVYMETAGLIDTTIDVPADVDSFIFEVTGHDVTTIASYGHIGVYVNNQIDGLIITKNFTKNVGTSSSPATDNVDYDLATDVNLYGYKPIGIINVRLKNNDCSRFHLYGFNIDDNGIAYIRTRSGVSGTSSTDLVAEFTVMYIKS